MLASAPFLYLADLSLAPLTHIEENPFEVKDSGTFSSGGGTRFLLATLRRKNAVLLLEAVRFTASSF